MRSAPIFALRRQAKTLSREQRLKYGKALDQVARREGFQSWSHLMADSGQPDLAALLLSELTAGDLVLLGARPGHGKTLLAMEAALAVARTGWRAHFFTLDYSKSDMVDRLRQLGHDPDRALDDLQLDTSDCICADYIIQQVGQHVDRTLVVVDYLQLLDQDRRHPDLQSQIVALSGFARRAGAVILFISQIDRRFEATDRNLPGLLDVRIVNPLDLSLFNKTCFLHNDQVQMKSVA